MSAHDDQPATSTDDEITIDPEATNAADANWLAELRSQARADGQSMAQLLADDADSEFADAAIADSADKGVDVDDEITIDHRGHRDEIRHAVRESQRQTPETPPAPTLEAPVTVDVASEPASPVPPPPAAPVAEPTPPPPTAQPSTTAPARWEAPSRLNTGLHAAPPALITSAATSRRFDWRIAVAIALAVVIGFVIALVVSGRTADAPIDDPTATTIVDEDDDSTESEQP